MITHVIYVYFIITGKKV